MMEYESNLKNIDETAILAFVTEAKNGKLGVISTTASQLPLIEAQREETSELIFYYSFQ